VAFSNRGIAWLEKVEYDKAIENYNEVIRLDPKNDDRIIDLAWLLATCPDESVCDGKRAVELAIRACELTDWKNDWALGTLAAAHARAGDFAKAIRYLEQAIELNADFDKENRDEMMRLFEAKKPYQTKPAKSDDSGKNLDIDRRAD